MALGRLCRRSHGKGRWSHGKGRWSHGKAPGPEVQREVARALEYAIIRLLARRPGCPARLLALAR